MNRERQKAFADWCLEISALFLVFPALDVALQHGARATWVAWTGFTVAIALGALGLYLVPEEKRP